MNIRSELRLEIIKDNFNFSLSLPVNVTYDMALSALQEFKNGLEEMQKISMENKQKEEPQKTDN